MIERVEISDFRGLDKFEFDPAPINLFVGRNNTGKSSALEAITIAASYRTGYRDALGQEILTRFAARRNWNLRYFVRIDSSSSKIHLSLSGTPARLLDVSLTFRGSGSEGVTDKTNQSLGRLAAERARRSVMEGITYERGLPDQAQREFDKLIEQPMLSVASEEREEVLLQKDAELVKSTPIISSWPETSAILFTGTHFENDLRQLHDALLPTGKFTNVMDRVKEGIPYLQDLRTLGNQIFVYQRNLDKPIPINLMGDGFRDILGIMFISALTRGGTAVFEEPENSLHPGFLGLASDYLTRTALESSSQLFISTHSLELLNYLLEKAADQTKVVRMSQVENTISYEVLLGKEALEELKDIGTDLRGV